MREKNYNLEQVLNNLRIEALNDMQQAAIEASEKMETYFIICNRIGQT